MWLFISVLGDVYVGLLRRGRPCLRLERALLSAAPALLGLRARLVLKVALPMLFRRRLLTAIPGLRTLAWDGTDSFLICPSVFLPETQVFAPAGDNTGFALRSQASTRVTRYTPRVAL